jgi:hypothetical protein
MVIDVFHIYNWLKSYYFAFKRIGKGKVSISVSKCLSDVDDILIIRVSDVLRGIDRKTTRIIQQLVALFRPNINSLHRAVRNALFDTK